MVASFLPFGARERLASAALVVAVVAAGCSGSSRIGGGRLDASDDGVAPGLEGDGGATGTGSGGTGEVGDSSGGGGPSSSGGGSGSGGDGGSSGAAPDAAAPLAYDGTLGKPCKLTTDCDPPGGPGVNVCSISAYGIGPLWPTPVCILVRCDPVGPGNGSFQYCDGPANDPTSPGICVPTTSPAQPSMGTCLPRCQFGVDGGAPTGCQGKDVCNFAGVTTTAGGAVLGEGYCYGGCALDADCPTGSHCQADEGTCLATLDSRTKMPGQGCTSADSTSTASACFCDYSPETNQGYCTQSCVVGGAPCPTGYLCDTGETTQLAGLAVDGGAIPGFGVQNAGMAGTCRASCPGSGEAGAMCPPNSSCSTVETVGPICAP